MPVQIKVGYLINGLWSMATINRFASVNMQAQISLSVEETPSFCTASIQPSIVSPKLQAGWCYDYTYLYVSFQENAPAVGPVNIKIKMQSIDLNAVMFEVKPATAYSTVQFTPNYRPIIDATPRVTYADTNPGKSIEIPIDLTNLGNADTEFVIKMNNVPNGWIASITPNKIVQSAANGGNPKATVILSVTPPYGFGYHDDTVKIELSIYGQYYAGAGSTNATILKTGVYTPSVTIKSRGFSTPGFEAVFVIFALVGVAFFVKKRQKTKKN
jgi:hypothetical protein